MKKLIFLISLCLLSQNYTIANENGESVQNLNSQAIQAEDADSILRVQNWYSSKKSIPPKPASAPEQNINKSDLKFPGLKVPEAEEEKVETFVENIETHEETVKPLPVVQPKHVNSQFVEAEVVKTLPTEEVKSEVTQTLPKKNVEPQTEMEELNPVQQEQETVNPVPQKNEAFLPLVNVQKQRKTEENSTLNKSVLKYPGLKIPQDIPETDDLPVQTELQQEVLSEPATDIQAETQPVQKEEPKTVEKKQEPLDAMGILRSQTKTPIVQTGTIKPIPGAIAQKYKINRNNISVEKSNSAGEAKDSNQPVTITINKVVFPESKVFTEEELQSLAAPLLAGPATLEDIKKVVADITRCYTLGDYPTAKAYLPPQKISDGVLRIELFEGTIGKINVDGNRWVRTSYFKKRIAYKQEGELLNVSDLEKDVVKFNNNNTAKVSVSLSAGENPGETDVTLHATEQFPFRLAVMTDNQGRKAIGTGRFGSMITTDSLFGVSDKLSLGGYLGRGNRLGFADYNIPVGRYGTRIGASAAAGNISVVNGLMRKFDVGGTSQVYSVYVTQPIYDAQGFNVSSYTAANFKKSTSDIMDFKFYDKSTFSLTQGFNLRKDTDRGIWYTGHYGSVGFKALNGDEDFFKYEGNITRLHDFGKGIVGQFRVSGQYSPDKNLPWMEQFQIGGMSTVRGYSEALLLGKSGYFASAEIIAPLPILPKRIGSDRLGYIYPREMIKGAVFMDNGMIFPYKYGQSIDSGELLMSWGFGLRVNIKDDLAARFYWGYGLHNRYDADYKMGRFHFDITCAPDIGKVVSTRNPAPKQKKSKKDKEEDL